MTDDETLFRIKKDAQAALFRIPGVRAVAIGHKYVAGKNTRQVAIIVEVDKKRPAADVPANEMIPATIEGIPTDVVEWQPTVDTVGLISDTSKDRPLSCGSYLILDNQKQDPVHNVTVSQQNYGTLGFFATTDGSIAGIPAGGIVAITCQHVVADTSGNTVKGKEIGQPTTDECSSCSFCCNDIIGKVIYGLNTSAGTTPGTDAALIALTKGLEYYCDIKGGIGPMAGPRTLGTADLNTTVLRKYGSTTGLTKGTVTTISGTVAVGSNSFSDGRITITPDPSTPVWDCCICETPPLCGGGASENFQSFGCAGDSGAAVVDSQNHVVGLLKSTTCHGVGTAIGIDIITGTMGVTVLTAATAGVKQTVPGVAGINMTVGEVPRSVAPFRISGAQQESFTRAREELVATPIGHDVAATVRAHHVEVLQLINTNRRVATIWHRNGGAELIEGVLRMLQCRDQPLPSEIRGRPLIDCLHRLQRAFERYGSPALAVAVNTWAPIVVGLVGRTYAELLATLQADARGLARRQPATDPMHA
jgi:hypothetical protein